MSDKKIFANKLELTTALKRDNFLKKLAVRFVKHKDMTQAAIAMGSTEDLIEEVFIDHPEIEEKFDNYIYEQATKLGYRKIRAGLDEAIGKLNELVTDSNEDQNNAFRSASKILDVWARIEHLKKPGSKEEKDDLDELWDSIIKDESGTKEDTKNN